MYFSAKLVFEIRPVTHGDDAVSIEKRIILIKATNECDAESEANAIGKGSEFTYEASDGGTVIVSFTGVEKIYRLIDETIGHGTEVYSEEEYKSL